MNLYISDVSSYDDKPLGYYVVNTNIVGVGKFSPSNSKWDFIHFSFHEHVLLNVQNKQRRRWIVGATDQRDTISPLYIHSFS